MEPGATDPDGEEPKSPVQQPQTECNADRSHQEQRMGALQAQSAGAPPGAAGQGASDAAGEHSSVATEGDPRSSKRQRVDQPPSDLPPRQPEPCLTGWPAGGAAPTVDSVLVGTAVSGQVTAASDSAYFITFRLGEHDFKGALFCPPAGFLAAGAGASAAAAADEAGDDPPPPPLKRNKTAFNFYSDAVRPQAKQRHPSLDQKGISRVVGEMWSHLAGEQKEPYHEMARQDKERYERELRDHQARFPQGSRRQLQRELRCPPAKRTQHGARLKPATALGSWALTQPQASSPTAATGTAAAAAAAAAATVCSWGHTSDSAADGGTAGPPALFASSPQGAPDLSGPLPGGASWPGSGLLPNGSWASGPAQGLSLGSTQGADAASPAGVACIAALLQRFQQAQQQPPRAPAALLSSLLNQAGPSWPHRLAGSSASAGNPAATTLAVQEGLLQQLLGRLGDQQPHGAGMQLQPPAQQVEPSFTSSIAAAMATAAASGDRVAGELLSALLTPRQQPLAPAVPSAPPLPSAVPAPGAAPATGL